MQLPSPTINIVWAKGSTPDQYGNRILLFHCYQWNVSISSPYFVGGYYNYPTYTWDGTLVLDGVNYTSVWNNTCYKYANQNNFWELNSTYDSSTYMIYFGILVAINKTLVSFADAGNYVNATFKITSDHGYNLTQWGYTNWVVDGTNFYQVQIDCAWQVAGHPIDGTNYKLQVDYYAWI